MRQTDLIMGRARGMIIPWASDLKRWTLVHGDSIDVMKKIPDRSIDLIFADPPYFLSNGGSTCKSGKRTSVSKGDWDRSRGRTSDHLFHVAWLEQARAVLKPSGTIWISATHHALFSIGFALQGLGFHVLNLATWCKPNASPNLAGRMFTHSTEHLIWASPFESSPLAHQFNYKLMKERNGGKQMRDFWSIPTTPAREKECGSHPTQKPEALLDRIISASSKPGDLILDPFTGSSTAGVVATRLDRRFIGIDLDVDYLALSKRRLIAEKKKGAK